MSKYSFVIRYRAIRMAAVAIPLAAAGIAICSLPASVTSWFPDYTVSVFLCSVVPAFLLILLAGQHKMRQGYESITVDGNRWYEPVRSGTVRPLTISSGSKVTIFGIYLAGTDYDGTTCYRWVLPGECKKLYYRRLVRLVQHQSQGD